VVVPAAASASTVWVSPQPVTTKFNSCANPGYNSIQKAIGVNAPSTVIHVCPGTYEEQLEIEKALTITAPEGATVKLPASPKHSATPCDVPADEQDLIAICGAVSVKLLGGATSHLTVAGAWPAGTCNEDLYGIFVGGKASLALTNASVTHAGAEPINGCQGGIGVQVGRNYTGQVGTASLTSDVITGYQKNGITVDGKQSKATIRKVMIESAPTSEIAQNGIQVSRGAQAGITESKIEGNECNVASCGPNEHAFSPWQEEEDATGVLFYKEGKGSVTKTTISHNDIGVYSLSEAETTTPQLSLVGDTLEANRYWGITLDQGYATVNKDTITGPARVGIQVVQYDEAHNGLAAGQEFGAKGKGSEDTVSGMTVCGVEGFSDNGPTDQFGSLTLTNSLAKFTGNAANVCNNNTTGKLVIKVT
jgi:hypothetical protein